MFIYNTGVYSFQSILFNTMTHASKKKRGRSCTSVALSLFSVQKQTESLCGETSVQRDRKSLPSVTFKVDQSIFPCQLSHVATARGSPSCVRGCISLNSCQSHPSHRQEPSSNAWKLPPRPHQSCLPSGKTTLISRTAAHQLCVAFHLFLSWQWLLKFLLEADWFQGGYLWVESILMGV